MTSQLQLRLPLPPEYLKEGSGPQTAEDSRMITELMEAFGLPEEEATAFYFQHIKYGRIRVDPV